MCGQLKGDPAIDTEGVGKIGLMHEQDGWHPLGSLLQSLGKIRATHPSVIKARQIDSLLPSAQGETGVDQNGQTGLFQTSADHSAAFPMIVISQDGKDAMSGIEPGQRGS